MSSSTHFTLLGRLLNGAATISRVAIWIAGSLTLISALYITVDIIARKFFNAPLGSSDELSGYAFAISISWALSFATLDRANIRIDAIYQHLPVRIAAVLDWIALIGLAIFIVYLTQYASEVASLSWKYQASANTILGTPLWIPQVLWALGLIWLCVILTLMLLRSTLALITGDLQMVSSVCGIRTTKEEASAEAESGKRLVQREQQ